MTIRNSDGAQPGGRDASACEDTDRPEAWRRNAEEQGLTEQLGSNLRARREARGWSLAAAERATGVSRATLSRIENNKMSPTAALFYKILRGFNMSVQDALGVDGPLNEGEITFFTGGPLPSLKVRGGTYFAPHLKDALGGSLEPVICKVEGRTVEDVGGLSSYSGIEFCYVLSGELTLHFEGRAPTNLRAENTALFNAILPHAYVCAREEPALFLKVISHTSASPA